MYKTVAKPLIDVIMAWLFLIMGLPLLAIVTMLYWVKGESPIFFVQPRIGKDNRKFNLYKLRTLNTIDQSSFSLGSFLRKYYLDELPQLWNVIKGDMSFIGPRPLLEEYIPLYNADQIKRHQIKPGITGWAQVNGGNNISWQQKFQLDIYYLNHLSFGLDLRIMIKTFQHYFYHRADTVHFREKFTGNQ